MGELRLSRDRVMSYDNTFRESKARLDLFRYKT